MLSGSGEKDPDQNNHGKSSAHKTIPPGMLIIENFLSENDCNKIIEHTENIKFSKARIEKTKNK